MFNCEHQSIHSKEDHWVVKTRDLSANRLLPRPVLTAVQQLERFLTSIRENNSLVVREKLEESDELRRRKKSL